MRRFVLLSVLAGCGVICLNCGSNHNTVQETAFTREDSITDRYLVLQDSLLLAWNLMMNDDNQKIKAMHHLLHELMVSGAEQNDVLVTYEERLDQLSRLRYTSKTMANMDVIEEYDFASNALVTELIALAESRKEFNYNPTLQKLTDEIRMADQRIINYRVEYDAIAAVYNSFIEENRQALMHIDKKNGLEKKPMFQMVSE